MYRIVQESLTNAARHAPGAPVRVEITYTADAVELAVVNAAADVRPTATAGHGLTGMAERATVVGGELGGRWGAPGRAADRRTGQAADSSAAPNETWNRAHQIETLVSVSKSASAGTG